MALPITKCNTINSLIEYGKTLDISHDKLHYKTTILGTNGNDIIINSSSLIDKYIHFLQPAIKIVTLTDVEYNKYIYQPKALCFDMYGSTELWSSILRINNLTSISEFTLKTIKIFTNKIFELLNEILILEKDELEKNRTDNNLM